MIELLLLGAVVWSFCLGYAVGKWPLETSGARVSKTSDEDPRRIEDGPAFGGQQVSKGKRRTPYWERGSE